MSQVYLLLLQTEETKINGEIFNAGYENLTVNKIGNLVKENIGLDVKIEKVKSNDNRSYHISSEKLKNKLGFNASHTIKDAILELKKSFEENKLPNSLKDSKYFNIKKMQEIELK